MYEKGWSEFIKTWRCSKLSLTRIWSRQPFIWTSHGVFCWDFERHGCQWKVKLQLGIPHFFYQKGVQKHHPGHLKNWWMPRRYFFEGKFGTPTLGWPIHLQVGGAPYPRVGSRKVDALRATMKDVPWRGGTKVHWRTCWVIESFNGRVLMGSLVTKDGNLSLGVGWLAARWMYLFMFLPLSGKRECPFIAFV